MEESHYRVVLTLREKLPGVDWGKILMSFSGLHDLLLLSEYGPDALSDGSPAPNGPIEQFAALNDAMRLQPVGFEEGSFKIIFRAIAKTFGELAVKIWELSARERTVSFVIEPGPENSPPKVVFKGPKKAFDEHNIGDSFGQFVRAHAEPKDPERTDEDYALKTFNDFVRITQYHMMRYQELWGASNEATMEYGNRLLGFGDGISSQIRSANIIVISLRQLKDTK